jgi:tetratricopeptide (TPR) repeat protein
MVEAEKSDKPNDAAPESEKVLASKPDYVPALLLKAKAARLNGQTKVAEEIYNRVLQRFPEFAPAQRDLAAVYVMDPQNNTKAYDLVTKARKTLSDDPELSRVIGTISYQRKDYNQAMSALQQSSRKKPLDAESLFYLGMSQMNAKQEVQGKKSLEQALAAGLDGPHADEAKGIVGPK